MSGGPGPDPDRDSDAEDPGSGTPNPEAAAASGESETPGSPDAAASDTADPDPARDAPLSGLAGRIADRRGRDTDDDSDVPVDELDPELSGSPPPEGGDDPFEEMSVGEMDEETLWSSLESDETAGVGDTVDIETDSLGGADPAPGVESVEDAGPEMREHVVPKKTYCQSCPYLDDPPALACTHEGTDIVAVVDSERFRVRDCPMVDE